MAEGGEAVQVAVRVRGFNQREIDAGATRIIRMEDCDQGSKTWVADPTYEKSETLKSKDEERDFKLDYSFQSFSETEEGIGPWASQDTVYNVLGAKCLANCMEGKNVCLFAYGQTGAGKSYSMLGKLGKPEQEGIVPRVCKQLFASIDADKESGAKHTVDIQVIEVYCEQINDLLALRKNWPPKGHKPVLTAKDGYVVDTTTRPCMSYEDIDNAINFADKNRSIGAHALNPESSRAHTIYQITYRRQLQSKDGKSVTNTNARLNLVDLAGSERTESAGTSGQMLKEGSAINLSLTALGSCIKALSEGKKPNYRDSKLTLLLQKSMTAGIVVMIAAVSPASICYQETLSTLRFATRIKQVKIKVAINVTTDPVAEVKKQMEEMRKAMQAEIDALKKQRRSSLGDQGSSRVDELKAELARLRAQVQAEKTRREELEAQLEEYRKQNDQVKVKEIMEELQKIAQSAHDADESKRRMEAELQALAEQKLVLEAKAKQMALEERAHVMESEEQRRKKALDQKREWESAFQGLSHVGKDEEAKPHFVNLHEDTRLAETLVYPFPMGKTIIGRADRRSPPDLEFGGLGILTRHCAVEHTPEGVFLSCRSGGRTLLNGRAVVDPAPLRHNDRVWLGNNYAFRFRFPGREGEARAGAEMGYLEAQEEVSAEEAKALGAAQDGGSSSMSPVLHQKVSEAINKVDQANIISSDLEKSVVFQVKLRATPGVAAADAEVVVLVCYPGGGTLIWPWEKFASRLVEMVMWWQEWQHASQHSPVPTSPGTGDTHPGDVVLVRDPEDDPFIDLESQLIGDGVVYLSPLANMVEVSAKISIISLAAKVQGKLNVEIMPCDKNGFEGPWDDDDLDPYVDEPEELLGSDVQFKVKVHDMVFDVDVMNKSVTTVKYRDTFVRYKIDAEDADEDWSTTTTCTTATLKPTYGYTQAHTLHCTKRILRHFQSGAIKFQLWGKPSEDIFKLQVLKKTTSLLQSAVVDAGLERKSGRLAEVERMLSLKQEEVERLNQRMSSLSGDHAPPVSKWVADIVSAVPPSGAADAPLEPIPHHAYQLVNEANAVACALGKDCVFTLLVQEGGRGRVYLRTRPSTVQLTWAQFLKRHEHIRQTYSTMDLTQGCPPSAGSLSNGSVTEDDPFTDTSYLRLATADVWMRALGNMVETSLETPLLSTGGSSCKGKLKVEVIPCHPSGKEITVDDSNEVVSDPVELTGTTLHFKIKVDYVHFTDDVVNGTESKFYATHVRYSLNPLDTNERMYRTAEVPQALAKVQYQYCKQHSREVDLPFVQLLSNGKITFELWGKVHQ